MISGSLPGFERVEVMLAWFVVVCGSLGVGRPAAAGVARSMMWTQFEIA